MNYKSKNNGYDQKFIYKSPKHSKQERDDY